ncbi:hypothetical protein [Patulibacter sp. SYSU D01012]|uniref:hypothetical protein n=1 Tax=Patulibacter sp. SYSU D01012 TaxID=2817381 RepID=UPI001B30D12C|nr:hypothetical protein [Patulibacter sp. SYSU D01012]
MASAPTTLVVSDLHLGSDTGADLLRRPGPALGRLLDALDGGGRLVVAGDLLELRHAPARVVLERARPVLRALGARLGPEGEVVVLTGNHDHRLLRPWLEERRLAGLPLGVDERVPEDAWPAAARALAAALAPAAVTFRYPAAWIVPPGPDGAGGVLAHHGHYVDVLWRMPTIERLVAGHVARGHGVAPGDVRTPDDFEALLAPGYGWIDGRAEHARGRGPGASQGTSAGVWHRLNDRRSLSGAALRAAVPLAVRALRRAGWGELETTLTPDTLRRAGTHGMATVAARLGVRPDVLVAGHTHRAGPLPGDDVGEWRLADGGRLVNTGSWVHVGGLATRGVAPGSAYWPGHAARVDADGTVELVGLLDDVALG